MANVESSWQASVLKLAQTGNLRAIAFWINRYLVPQGICAQVLADKPGSLLIRVVCHNVPDGDRLVQFICQQLASLHSEAIRTVRITAQRVGVSDLLWDRSADLKTFTLQPAPAAPKASPQAKPQPAPSTVNVSNAPSPSHRLAPQPVDTQASQTTVAQALQLPFETPIRRPAKRPLPRWKRWTRTTLRHVILLPQNVQQITSDSATWFNGQTLPVRALTISGSAVAVFLLGCGFEVLRQYTIDPNFGRTASRVLPISPPGTVQAALESVPVIPATGIDPEDPAITLLFSNSAALAPAPKLQTNQTQFDITDPADRAAITRDRQADLMMTSLDNPLTLLQAMPRPESRDEDPDEADDSSAAVGFPMPEQTVTTPHALSETEELETEDENPNSLRLPKTTIQELLANQVDVVAMASPQTTTPQTAELVQTLEVLQRSQIHAVGAGQDSRETRRPMIFAIKGKRIAYLGYSDPSRTHALAAMAGVAPVLEAQIAEDIHAIREQVDWVIVNFNWQRALRAYPEDWQIALSHFAIDQGADLVVGYHPDLTQGAEVYQGRAIVYSIGSSVDEYVDEYSSETMPDRDTVSLKVTLEDEQMKVELIPIQIRQGQAADADADAAEVIMDYMRQASSLFAQPLRSPTVLDARVRMSLPTAPDADVPTDPFLSYPESAE